MLPLPKVTHSLRAEIPRLENLASGLGPAMGGGIRGRCHDSDATFALRHERCQRKGEGTRERERETMGREVGKERANAIGIRQLEVNSPC